MNNRKLGMREPVKSVGNKPALLYPILVQQTKKQKII